MTDLAEGAIILPGERPGHPAAADLLARRAMVGGGVSRFPPVPGVEVSEARLGGVRALRIRPAGPPRATVLHLHGGGFRLGAPENSVGFGSTLAGRTGVQVIAPAYRLAPENPYPAGLADALATLLALSEAERSRVILSGDSAGGGLAASLTRLALSRGIKPLGLMLFAPWLDMTVTSPSYEENATRDQLFSRDSAITASGLYLQGHSPTDPLASPLHGSVADYPSTLVIVSEHEVLRDDSVKYAGALNAAGRPVTLIRTPDMEHVAVTRDPTLTGAVEGMEATIAFLEQVLPRR
jgi:monoterpene epsilon-lactone hydrolase